MQTDFDPYTMLFDLQKTQVELMQGHARLLSIVSRQSEEINLLLEMQKRHTQAIRKLEDDKI